MKSIVKNITLISFFIISSFLPLAATSSAEQEGGSKNLPEQTEPQESSPKPSVDFEGAMTIGKMRAILRRLDENLKEPREGNFVFLIDGFQVAIFTAPSVNRMRVMVRVRSSENLKEKDLLRISQANLDAALDARYAIGNGVLWSTFIHPLSSLHPRQFLEAIGSTVNLAANYGTTYSSGQLIFGGGDSRGIIGRQLIDKLIKKGQPI